MLANAIKRVYRACPRPTHTVQHSGWCWHAEVNDVDLPELLLSCCSADVPTMIVLSACGAAQMHGMLSVLYAYRDSDPENSSQGGEDTIVACCPAQASAAAGCAALV